ncbi:hypothetical protein INT45_009142 [Circinella minor]|uniref:ATP-dependent DNA helicase n=1 Tax=Circinella minor TaxID=1195481 RepID=A0A8H7VMG5_9FUNG|nr:hypothetical protein INT45_009142 [Circinella minor]
MFFKFLSSEPINHKLFGLSFLYRLSTGSTTNCFFFPSGLSSGTTRKIVLTVAFSGIAVLLLRGSRTGLSFIIWDEPHMRHSFASEPANRLLQDIMGRVDSCYEHITLSGKAVVIDGDSRQTFPIVSNRNKPDILSASLPNTQLFQYFENTYLTENMDVPGNANLQIIDALQ